MKRKHVLPVLLIAMFWPAAVRGETSLFDVDNGIPLWELRLRPVIGYDDNVPFAPRQTFYVNAEKESPFASLMVDGLARLIRTKDTQIGAGLAFQKLWFLDRESDSSGDPNDYDLTVLSPRVFIRRRFDGLGRPAEAGFTYAYRHEWVQIRNGSFSRSHHLTWDVTTEVMKNLELSADYRASFWDYFHERLTPGLHDKDGTTQNVGASAKLYFNERRSSFLARYDYTNEDTHGRDFKWYGNKITGRLESKIINRLSGAVQASWQDRNYHGYTAGFIPAPGRKSLEVTECLAQLVYGLAPGVSLDVFAAHTEWQSNSAFWDADRFRVGAGLTISLAAPRSRR